MANMRNLRLLRDSSSEKDYRIEALPMLKTWATGLHIISPRDGTQDLREHIVLLW
jgi:hypothetical protein